MKVAELCIYNPLDEFKWLDEFMVMALVNFGEIIKFRTHDYRWTRPPFSASRY